MWRAGLPRRPPGWQGPRELAGRAGGRLACGRARSMRASRASIDRPRRRRRPPRAMGPTPRAPHPRAGLRPLRPGVWTRRVPRRWDPCQAQLVTAPQTKRLCRWMRPSQCRQSRLGATQTALVRLGVRAGAADHHWARRAQRPRLARRARSSKRLSSRHPGPSPGQAETPTSGSIPDGRTGSDPQPRSSSRRSCSVDTRGRSGRCRGRLPPRASPRHRAPAPQRPCGGADVPGSRVRAPDAQLGPAA